MKLEAVYEEQIISLKEHELGAKTADLYASTISEATFYNWKSKFAVATSEAKRLKQLQDENGKLKKPLADAMPTTRP
jgi:putative transposase